MRHTANGILAGILIIAGLMPLTAAEKQTPAAASLITVSPDSEGDDDVRIQQAIDRATGTVFFKAGVYKLKRSVRLKSGLTYLGEGSFHVSQPAGSVLMQTARPDRDTDPGLPIFIVDGTISSVTITGLTFYSAQGMRARGIAATSGSVLTSSTIRENYFLTDLEDCVDTPMVSTRIERNQFGQNGGSAGVAHRHIRSLRPDRVPATTDDNWIVGNVFRQACCATGSADSQSVFFESVVPLHIIGNNFETNDVETTIRTRGTAPVDIQGNWFEGNHGHAQMTFGKGNSSGIRLENNWYSMYGWQRNADGTYAKVPCNRALRQGNCFLFEFEPDSGASAGSRVFIGYEAGRNFSSGADLTTDAAAPFLTITGPLCIPAYSGTQGRGYVLDCR